MKRALNARTAKRKTLKMLQKQERAKETEQHVQHKVGQVTNGVSSREHDTEICFNIRT